VYAAPGEVVGAAWSPDGNTVAIAMTTEQPFEYEIYLLALGDSSASPRQISRGISGIGGSISWSADQKSLLIFAGPVSAREIYKLDIETGAATQLTFGGNNASAAYSPDGQHIVFNSLRNQGQADLYVMRADGHSLRQLTNNPEPDWQPEWGP
jgi:TolB protein